MKVLQINSVCGRGSTGRIATDLADILKAQGHECRIAYGRDSVPEKYQDIAVRIGSDWDVRIHGVQTRLFDAHGFGSKAATAKFLKWAQEYDPDIIHLHNIHGYYINVELLFDYLKQAGKPVIWTLHDCWAFTGHCPYFTAAKCEHWRTGCHAPCPEKQRYPQSVGMDRCEENFSRKKKAFWGVPNLTIITPSQWLADVVKESFLKVYPVKAIPNGIDRSVFKPTPGDFRKRYGLEGKQILLGVANVWDKRKGLDDFIKLSLMLSKNQKIVLVGLSAEQLKTLPQEIIGIRHTNSVQELAEIYTAADIYINPSVEETMGLTTAEALACGTPVVTYNCTAVPEVADEACGIAVDPAPKNLLQVLCEVNFSKQACLARADRFEKGKQYLEYLELYQKVYGG